MPRIIINADEPLNEKTQEPKNEAIIVNIGIITKSLIFIFLGKVEILSLLFKIIIKAPNIITHKKMLIASNIVSLNMNSKSKIVKNLSNFTLRPVVTKPTIMIVSKNSINISSIIYLDLTNFIRLSRTEISLHFLILNSVTNIYYF